LIAMTQKAEESWYKAGGKARGDGGGDDDENTAKISGKDDEADNDDGKARGDDDDNTAKMSRKDDEADNDKMDVDDGGGGGDSADGGGGDDDDNDDDDKASKGVDDTQKRNYASSYFLNDIDDDDGVGGGDGADGKADDNTAKMDDEAGNGADHSEEEAQWDDVPYPGCGNQSNAGAGDGGEGDGGDDDDDDGDDDGGGGDDNDNEAEMSRDDDVGDGVDGKNSNTNTSTDTPSLLDDLVKKIFETNKSNYQKKRDLHIHNDLVSTLRTNNVKGWDFIEGNMFFESIRNGFSRNMIWISSKRGAWFWYACETYEEEMEETKKYVEAIQEKYNKEKKLSQDEIKQYQMKLIATKSKRTIIARYMKKIKDELNGEGGGGGGGGGGAGAGAGVGGGMKKLKIVHLYALIFEEHIKVLGFSIKNIHYFFKSYIYIHIVWIHRGRAQSYIRYESKILCRAVHKNFAT